MNELDKLELFDFKTRDFSPVTSLRIFELLTEKTCHWNHCDGNLISHKARYYKCNEGWENTRFYDKIYIWFECEKCHHGWGLNYLGVKKNTLIQI